MEQKAYAERWIWLDEAVYPDVQTTAYSILDDNGHHNYAVAEFRRRYDFDRRAVKAELVMSADTCFDAFLNGKLLATGPVSAGGDFLRNDFARPTHYSTRMTVEPDTDTLNFYVRVKLSSAEINEYSMGHGGLMLNGRITFEDGTQTVIYTDESWLCRKNGAYAARGRYDNSIAPDEYGNARFIQNIWHCTESPIPPRTETLLRPETPEVTVNPGEKKTIRTEFDRIYAGLISLRVKTGGRLRLCIGCFEALEPTVDEEFVFVHDDEYRGLQLHSIGGYEVTLELDADSDGCATVELGMINTHYPAPYCAETRTSDAGLNRVVEVCVHTLKQCRQMIHLDGPRHNEPLACTGDYYIESLMTAFSFGDMTLAKQDVLRTAELLRYNGARMYHTTYSLIWVQMLYDVYLYTGDEGLLHACTDALIMLMERFDGFVSGDGIIDNPHDFMFVDWIYIDGISLHHPPKALGQTCLNAYYYGMLCTAEKIFRVTGQEAMAGLCCRRAEELRGAVNRTLYDSGRGLYFEGLNTPTPEEDVVEYELPQNVEKRYYRCHANILAACFGLCDRETARRLLSRVMEWDELGECQPYFMHFLLEAVYRSGLREEYTLKILEKWKKPVNECPKGLAEGFIKPEPTYMFDHSHAWAGTPAYSLPKALTGLELIEPGFKKISLSPSLLGLDSADVEIPTPYGPIFVRQRRGARTEITVPDGVELCGIR